MGHSIKAFVTPGGAIDWLAIEPPVAVVPLAQNLELIPLTAELWEWIHHKPAIEARRYGGRLAGWNEADYGFLKRLAGDAGQAAFIETEYHGGDGTQGALVAQRDRIAYGPAHGDTGPINDALRLLGVRAGQAFDEFDSLDLRRFRDDGQMVREYYLRYWQRAYFGLPSEWILQLEEAARLQTRLKSEMVPGMLHSCPFRQPPENLLQSFLLENASSMKALDLSIEDHWLISSFYRIRYKLEVTPSRLEKLASNLFDSTNVQHQVWHAEEAASISAGLKADKSVQAEFARFWPYDIPDAHPPPEAIESFPANVRKLRDCFSETKPGCIGLTAIW